MYAVAILRQELSRVRNYTDSLLRKKASVDDLPPRGPEELTIESEDFCVLEQNSKRSAPICAATEGLGESCCTDDDTVSTTSLNSPESQDEPRDASGAQTPAPCESSQARNLRFVEKASDSSTPRHIVAHPLRDSLQPRPYPVMHVSVYWGLCQKYDDASIGGNPPNAGCWSGESE